MRLGLSRGKCKKRNAARHGKGGLPERVWVCRWGRWPPSFNQRLRDKQRNRHMETGSHTFLNGLVRGKSGPSPGPPRQLRESIRESRQQKITQICHIFIRSRKRKSVKTEHRYGQFCYWIQLDKIRICLAEDFEPFLLFHGHIQCHDR